MPRHEPSSDPDAAALEISAPDRNEASRRTVLRGALLTGVAAPMLAACGGSDSAGSDAVTTSSAKSSADAIASVTDVPNGGGLILDDPGIVITQPTAGEFKGFTNICTHAGCPVHDVTDGTINCTCHGSKFSIQDGSVVGGPAPKPLPETKIAVTGQDITLA